MTHLTDPTRITLVEQQKRRSHRYNIYLNDEYAFSVHEDVLLKHRLFKGEEVNSERLHQVVKDEELHQAYIQALRFITRKPRSKKEIERKLEDKGYEQETIQLAMQKLVDHKYINDQEFASMLTEYRVKSQKKGRKWVKQELIQKGLSKEHVEQAIEQIDENVEFQLAYELGKKRWERQSGKPRDKYRKVGSLLLRRGYTQTLVSQVLRTIQSEGNEEEWED